MSSGSADVRAMVDAQAPSVPGDARRRRRGREPWPEQLLKPVFVVPCAAQDLLGRAGVVSFGECLRENEPELADEAARNQLGVGQFARECDDDLIELSECFPVDVFGCPHRRQDLDGQVVKLVF